MSSKPPSIVSFSSVGPESEVPEKADTRRSGIGNGSDTVLLPMTDDERDELLRSVAVRVERVDAEVDAMSSAVESAAGDARETRDAQRVIESDVRHLREGQDMMMGKMDSLIEAFVTFKGQFQTTAPAPAPSGDLG